jgi:Rrf2 family protein
MSSTLLELSARVEYAFLALLEMASRYTHKEPLKISEITAKQPIPNRYLEQILTSLRRSGIVQSQRGAKGGYVLAREPWRITLLEILLAVEGDFSRDSAAQRDASPDPKRSGFLSLEENLVKEIWQQAVAAAQDTLGQYTLQDLCQRRDLHRQTNPMYYI